MSPPCRRCPPPIEEPDISIKLLQLNVVSEAMTRLGWSPGHAPLIGALELVFAGLYGDPLVSHTLFGVCLGAFAWSGLWLRDARLRALAPRRQWDAS